MVNIIPENEISIFVRKIIDNNTVTLNSDTILQD